MTVLKARDLFDRINAMSSLNSYENIYCKNFFCKVLLIYIHKNLMKYLSSRFGKHIRQDKRFAGIYWTHILLHFCFGHDLKGGYTEHHPKRSIEKKSALCINKMFLENLLEEEQKADSDESLITEDLLKKIGIYDNLQLLFKTAQTFKLCLEYEATLKKCPDKNAMKEMLVWLLNHIRDNTITASQAKEQKAKLHKVFKTFYETRTEKGLSQNQTGLAHHRSAMFYLDELACATGINLDEKNRPLTQTQKDAALAKSDKKCPICKCDLTNQNMEYDHVNCKSKFKNSMAICVCESCNQRKSNWTSEELSKYSNYIKSHI